MKIEELAPEALRLPAKDRVLLAASLWESIEDPYDLAVALGDDEAISLAMERDEEIESGKVKALSHSELEEVRDYYESQSIGLGRDFVDEFERQVLRIAAMPERWMVVRGDLRRSLMKRFPYVIFFRILEGDAIRVTVVKHVKRHPSFGMRRK